MTDQTDDAAEYEDQDSEPTNTAPPGERPTDPGPMAEAAENRPDSPPVS